MNYIKDLNKEKYFNEGKFTWPLFDREVNVYLDFDVDEEYADKCIEHLINLNDDMMNKIYESTVRYCESVREYFEELNINIPEGISGKDILKYVSPSNVLINKVKDGKIGYHIEFNCAWEREHGMEWTIKEDKLLFVGEFTDVDANTSDDIVDKSYNYVVK